MVNIINFMTFQDMLSSHSSAQIPSVDGVKDILATIRRKFPGIQLLLCIVIFARGF